MIITFVKGYPIFNFIIITGAFLVATFVCIWFGISYLKKAKEYQLQKNTLEELESFDNNESENQILQRLCPECGEKHDVDYPKCPYCNHSYITN
jgi:hypothetical protein